MNKQEQAVITAEKLVRELRDLMRYLPYEQDYLVKIVVEQAETLRLLTMGLGALEFEEVDVNVENSFAMQRASDSWQNLVYNGEEL